MMKFCSLYSGSSGNCLFAAKNQTKVLIDAGLSGKKIENALNEIDESAADLSGIVVTHEHRDHIHGIGVLARRYHLPIYVNKETWMAMKRDVGRIDDVRFFETGNCFVIGDMEITSFSVSHDAADPVGFLFNDGKKMLGIATDTGIITDEIKNNLKKAHLVVIESNHDENMVETGPYPYPLKRRILSRYGHLSNNVAAKMACEAVTVGNARHIVLAHLSEQNNYPYLANQTTETALNALDDLRGISLEVAKRDRRGHLYEI